MRAVTNSEHRLRLHGDLLLVVDPCVFLWTIYREIQALVSQRARPCVRLQQYPRLVIRPPTTTTTTTTTTTSMASLNNCFTEDTIFEPVRFLCSSPSGSSSNQFTTLEQLNAHLNDGAVGDYTCLAMSVPPPLRACGAERVLANSCTRSICQRNSWMPLQISRSMLKSIASHYGVNPSFWEVPSCFYRRNMDLEEVVCVPYTQSINESCIGQFIIQSYFCSIEASTHANSSTTRRDFIYNSLPRIQRER